MVACTLVYEGTRREVAAQEAAIAGLMRRHRGMRAGAENGRRGYQLTFGIAYLRDFVMRHWVLGESFETSVPWSRVLSLCDNVKQRLHAECAARGVPGRPFVTARVTQLYQTGVCVYFYFGFYHKGMADPLSTYLELERAAREEILAPGGSISHHHGVGKLRRGFLTRIFSPAVLEWSAEIKRAIDPNNVFGIGNLTGGRSGVDRAGRTVGAGRPSAMTTQREFLLTGVTGFLGKVVLEELVRRREELGLERVHVIIRPRKGLTPEERFQREVAASACFARLPPDWRDAVEIVEGTLEKTCLGISAEARERLGSRVTHVLHAAASVSFDLPLNEAARSNVDTTVHLLELARACRRLERLVYVSTAYVTPHPGNGAPIPEALAPLPWAPEDLYHRIQNGDADEKALLRESRHPNTYTLTKCLAEHLLVARHGEVPALDRSTQYHLGELATPLPRLDRQHGRLRRVRGADRAGPPASRGGGAIHPDRPGPRGRLVATRMLDECVHPSNRRHCDHSSRRVGAGPQPAGDRLLGPDSGILPAPPGGPAARHPVRRPPGDPVRDRREPPSSTGGPTRRDSLAGAPAIRGPTALPAHLPEPGLPLLHLQSFDFRSASQPEPGFEPGDYVTTVCRGIYRHILDRDEAEWTLAGRQQRGLGESDFHWAFTQPAGNLWIRTAAWVATKLLRRAAERITVDIPSFEAARRAAADGEPIALVPNHRSYLDFVLCSYLCFARPDLRIGIPYIAAAIEFGRIPLLGRILTWLHAFYLRRGTGPDPDLTRRVHQLVKEGKTLEFFVEGQRSRSREFLPPKRGLLRVLQSTGQSFTLLPVAFTYDRVPEEQSFAKELAGAPKPKMRLTGLLHWAVRAWRGKVHLGRIHIACGAPVRLGPDRGVQEVADEVIARLEEATVATTYHLEAFLARYALDGLDHHTLRQEIELRGGRVLESPLRPETGLDTRIAHTFRYQFQHYFRTGNDEVPFDRILSDIREREPVG